MFLNMPSKKRNLDEVSKPNIYFIQNKTNKPNKITKSKIPIDN